MATLIQHRRDTLANWATANPTLAPGEWGYETDTKKMKIGDSVTPWITLAYVDLGSMNIDGGTASSIYTTGEVIGAGGAS